MGLVNPYCTVAQVREFIRNTETSIETTLEEAINGASRWIDEYKGFDYFEHDHLAEALRFDRWSKAIYGEILYLPAKPIIEVTEVMVMDTVWIADTDFRTDEPTGRLISYQNYWIGEPCHHGAVDRWLANFRNTAQAKVTVKGRFGYEQRDEPVAPATLGALNRALVPAGMPDHITQACIQIAATLSRWNMKDVVGLDGQRTSILATDMPKTALQLLGSNGNILI